MTELKLKVLANEEKLKETFEASRNYITQFARHEPLGKKCLGELVELEGYLKIAREFIEEFFTTL